MSALFEGKKLLVLAGAAVHVKLVKAAQRLGVTTYVTDCLSDSPAKALSDFAWDLDVRDVSGIVERCVAEGVDGVVSGWIDPCQVPYGDICAQLGVPCYGTPELFSKMTNKRMFKAECDEYGVGVIQDLAWVGAAEGAIPFPVFVKPAESRGSRGQSVCWDRSDLEAALAQARGESSDGEAIVERYIGGVNSFQVTLFFVDGEAHVIRTADGYKGSLRDGLDRVALCSASPSIYADDYLQLAHGRVAAMLKGMGLENGPAMLQGFYVDGGFRFYDPGLRFPGVDYDLVWKRVHGVDMARAMVEFALTGRMPKIDVGQAQGELGGMAAAVLFPTVRSGRIAGIRGFESIASDPAVCSVLMRHGVGDEVGSTGDVNQRLAEIDVVCPDKAALRGKVADIVSRIEVVDERGADMLVGRFDASRID